MPLFPAGSSSHLCLAFAFRASLRLLRIFFTSPGESSDNTGMLSYRSISIRKRPACMMQTGLCTAKNAD